MAVAAAWFGFSVLSVWLTLRTGGPALDTDSSMRLAELRDLLRGQSWFDLTQWRMDTPYGLAMHWTRPVDAALAALVLLFRPFVGPQAAETVAIYAWPLLTLLGTLLALARIAQQLGGARAGIIVLVLAITCVNALGHFAPGSIDHHNAMMALTLWSVAFLLDAQQRPRAGAWAALCVTASLLIGMESLPYAAVTIAAVAVLWLRDGQRAAKFVRSFGVALAGSALLFLLAATDARYRFAAACDTYSAFYAVLLVSGGAGLAAVAPSGRTVAARAGLLAAIGVAALLLAAGLGTRCFAGPYASLDPQLRLLWLPRITEAQPAFTFAKMATSEFVAGYVYAAAGALATLVLAVTRRDRASIVMGVFCVVALAVATAQIRAVAYALLLGLPAIAAWLERIMSLTAARRVVGRAVFGFALLVSCDAAFAVVGGTLIEPNAHVAARISAYDAEIGCGAPDAMAPLRRLRRGRVAAFVDQGPAVLAYTDDSAISGPYHRDADGILDTYRIFTAPPADAARVLKRRGIDYVMTCSASRDWAFFRARSARDGILLRKPAWLEPAGHDATGRVQVYRVRL